MNLVSLTLYRFVAARQISVVLWGCGLLAIATLSQAQEQAPADAPPPAEASSAEVAAKDGLTQAENEQPPALGDPGSESPGKPATEPSDEAQSVPQTYPESRYAAVWSKNPFQTKTPVIQGPAGPGLADDWNLSSVTSVGQAFTIRIRNNKTNESRKLTDKADKDGFRIVQVNANRDRKMVTAKIEKGTETADLKYPDTVLGGGGAAGGGGAPVAPGTAGRMPGQAGLPNTTQNRPGMPNANLNRPGMPMRTGVNQLGPGGVGTPQQQQAAVAAQKQQAAMNQTAQRTLTGPGGVPLTNTIQNPGTIQSPSTFQRPSIPGVSNAPGAPPSPVQRRRVLIPQPIPTTDGSGNNPVQ